MRFLILNFFSKALKKSNGKILNTVQTVTQAIPNKNPAKQRDKKAPNTFFNKYKQTCPKIDKGKMSEKPIKNRLTLLFCPLNTPSQRLFKNNKLHKAVVKKLKPKPKI